MCRVEQNLGEQKRGGAGALGDGFFTEGIFFLRYPGRIILVIIDYIPPPLFTHSIKMYDIFTYTNFAIKKSTILYHENGASKNSHCTFSRPPTLQSRSAVPVPPNSPPKRGRHCTGTEPALMTKLWKNTLIIRGVQGETR